MKPRRPGRMTVQDLTLRELQRLRLLGVARGDYEPVCEREALFLWSLRSGDRTRVSDYILPPVLFVIEQTRLDLEAADGDAAEPADSGPALPNSSAVTQS